MDSISRVVIDACVLANFGLCDLFLTLGETPGFYQPLWSRRILDEVQRTQILKLGWPDKLSHSWREAVLSAFPESLVTGEEAFLEDCTNHEKDRHVLAAAIRGRAQAIVTCNLKHFSKEALKPWKLRAMHPAECLITLYSMNPGVVVSRLEEIARKRKRTPKSQLTLLGRIVPSFAAHLAEELGWDLRDS